MVICNTAVRQMTEMFQRKKKNSAEVSAPPYCALLSTSLGLLGFGNSNVACRRHLVFTGHFV